MTTDHWQVFKIFLQRYIKNTSFSYRYKKNLVAVALLFFGGKKIPELMRGLGGGIREFKDAMKDGEAEKKEDLDKRDILDRSEQLKKLEEKNQ